MLPNQTQYSPKESHAGCVLTLIFYGSIATSQFCNFQQITDNCSA
jgi:hypothetical protein